MTGKQNNLIKKWLLDFSNNASEICIQADIDFFNKNVQRRNWINTAWEIYKFIIKEKNENSYDFSICLSFPLKNYKHFKKAPNYFIKTKALSKTSPPGITLTKSSLEELRNHETYIPLENYNERYKDNNCYLVHSEDHGIFWRWIEIQSLR